MVVQRRHLQNFGPGLSVILPEVVSRGQGCIIARQRHLKIHNKKSVIISKVTNDVEIAWLSSYTCPHNFNPLESTSSIPQRRCGDYNKETLQSLASVRLRAVVMAPTRKLDTPTVTSRQYGRRAIFVSKRRQISRWRCR